MYLYLILINHYCQLFSLDSAIHFKSICLFVKLFASPFKHKFSSENGRKTPKSQILLFIMWCEFGHKMLLRMAYSSLCLLLPFTSRASIRSKTFIFLKSYLMWKELYLLINKRMGQNWMALIVFYLPCFYSLAVSIHESQTHLPIKLMKTHDCQSMGYKFMFENQNIVVYRLIKKNKGLSCLPLLHVHQTCLCVIVPTWVHYYLYAADILCQAQEIKTPCASLYPLGIFGSSYFFLVCVMITDPIQHAV